MFNGALLVIMLCTFHGLTEITNILYPGADYHRVLVDQEAVDRWVLLVGFAIFLFSVAYTWTVKRIWKSRLQRPAHTQPQVNLPVLLAIAIIAFSQAVANGQTNYQYGQGNYIQNAYTYWIAGLSADLFLLAMVMSSVGLILLCARRWTLPLIVAEALLLTIFGQRLEVIAGIVMTAGAIARYGRPLKFKHFCIGLLLLAALSALISASRNYYGRKTFSSSMGERLLNIRMSALTALSDPDLDLASDFLYRFDGNIFPTLVNESFREGSPGAGLGSLGNNFLLYIPSFFYTSKLESSVEDRDERTYILTHFGLDYKVDMAATLFAILFAYYGAVGLMCFAAGLGVVFAYLDRWVNFAGTTLSYIAGLGLTYCCIIIEQGAAVYFATFRIVICMLFVMTVTSGFRRSTGRSQKSRDSSSRRRAGPGGGFGLLPTKR